MMSVIFRSESQSSKRPEFQSWNSELDDNSKQSFSSQSSFFQFPVHLIALKSEFPVVLNAASMSEGDGRVFPLSQEPKLLCSDPWVPCLQHSVTWHLDQLFRFDLPACQLSRDHSQTDWEVSPKVLFQALEVSSHHSCGSFTDTVIC
jgi:hypothetical protein